MKTSSSSSKLQRGTLVAAFLVAAWPSQGARAAEESAWAFLGFSDDGGYAAVEVFGAHADGASPYSTIRVVDVKTNQFAAAAIVTCVGPGCEAAKSANPSLKEVRTQNRQKAKETLARFRIDVSIQGERSKLPGKQRTPADQGGGMAREAAQLRWLGTDWTLVLQEVAVPGGAEGDREHPRMIDLRAQRLGTEIILQKDRSLPKSRGAGVYWYELDSAVTYRNSLLVVLRYVRPGSRGPEVSQLFVTAGAL